MLYFVRASRGYVKGFCHVRGALLSARIRQRPSVHQSAKRARTLSSPSLPLPVRLSSQEPLKREREKRHGVIVESRLILEWISAEMFGTMPC